MVAYTTVYHIEKIVYIFKNSFCGHFGRSVRRVLSLNMFLCVQTVVTYSITYSKMTGGTEKDIYTHGICSRIQR